MTSAAVVKHHFTVDVEEYFQVSAMAPHVARSAWDATPTRLEVGMRPILDLLREHDQKGTFFILGWIAKRHPELVREIAASGHEVASHGWGHEKVTDLTPDQFRESIRDSKQILEDLSGQSVFGYRAPSFSIVRGREWALDILLEESYRYDSSLFPVKRSGYGFAGGERDRHRLQRSGGTLDELPPATVKLGGELLPAGGGAYFRLFPYALIQSALRSAARRGEPATFYIHPWELDPQQPRIQVPLHTKIRHYGGLSRTGPRLRRLFRDFRFQTIAQTLDLEHVAA
jgi:polysaccharide deacetylase family protein (PEP-CTERM system associated)